MPSSLLDLSVQRVLQDEAALLEALEWLPSDLFPPLFKAAVLQGQREIVKAMTASWPFSRLPLGALLKAHRNPLDVLKAALEGLGVLLSQQAQRRRCNLKVLDLNLNDDFNDWKGWAVTQRRASGAPSGPSESTRSRGRSLRGDRPGAGPPHVLLAPVKLVRDVCCFAEQEAPDEVLAFLIGRLEQGTALPQLWCRKLAFVGLPPDLPILEGILTMVQPESVQELKVEGFWDVQELNVFSPFLAQMAQLHTLFLANCSLHAGASGKREDSKVRRLLHQFSSQLLSVSRLRHLTLQSVTLLGDYLHLLLRFLQAPLETLGIRHCILGNPDLTYLSSLPCTSHLRSLDLSGVRRAGCHYKFLPALLRRVSATLESLDLADCGLHDADLTDLLPALCTCSRLRSLMLCGNLVSMAVLQHLLALTLPRCTFAFLQLPVPLHCYVPPRFALHQGTLDEVIAELRPILQPYRPLRVFFDSRICYKRCDVIYVHLNQ
ncbi:melanoma antigen preferentially expressed in tumors-like [Tenrec ecaudatus]|uniref:melanoma antigen preferentially expressed in tumors-like n=1 Tax=Tenrec ecaudatus TaxID=94439 RepID=UPI003F5A98E3